METLILIALITLFLGIIIGYFIRQVVVRNQARSAEQKIKAQLEEAKTKAKEIVLDAKGKAATILAEAQKEEKERKKELSAFEQRLNRREELLNQKLTETEAKNHNLEENIKRVKEIKQKVEELRLEAQKELERVANLSIEDARQELFAQLEKTHQQEIADLLRRMEKDKRDELDKEAFKILEIAIQRLSRSVSSEITTSVFTIDDEELKGKIIGREGRNIRALERLTGVDIIIDEAPDAITLSSFDPLRRELAKISLEKLIKDGRIQPAKIEEKVEEAKKELNEKIKEAGEKCCF